MPIIDYELIKNSQDIKTYITRADDTLIAMGYTEHSFAHVTKCAVQCGKILSTMGYDQRMCELGKIAGYMHDIGNVINRIDHAQSGAVLAFRLLDKMEMSADEIATVISAIGNHDESTGSPINPVAAALILADKSDVRRSRVRSVDISTFDIHDRVNYAVVSSDLTIDTGLSTIKLTLKIDTEICAVMDYFEIFLSRMLLCRRAAEYLGLKFKLDINGLSLL